MSKCTPEVISRKRKIAQGRLEQFKQRRLNNSGGNFAELSPMKAQSTAPAVQFSGPSIKSNSQPNPNPFLPAQLSKNCFQMQQTTPYIAANIRIVTCRCAMISEHRFAVYMSEFHQKPIDVCKMIPSRVYDPNKRIWSFDIRDYGLVEEKLGALKPNIETIGIPPSIIRFCTKKSETNEDSMSSYMLSITDTIANALMPFQKDGVEFGIKKNGRVFIADEMGLGKTIQALALADFYKEDWPVFIATPATTRDHWVAQIRQFLPYVNCHYIACVQASHEFFDDAKMVICSYQMMEKCLDKLEAMNFGVLIMDESHALKNSKAKCTKVAEKLAKKARRVILLSGTPALSRPVELFSQLKMLDGKFMSFMDYTLRYCEGKATAYGWDASGQSNLEELQVILTKKFMIRRIKADVLPDLATKYRETINLDPALITRNSLLNKYAKNFSQGAGRMNEELLLQYYAETAKVKIPAVCAYVKQLAKDKIKFIVFAHHRVMMEAICDCLSELKVDHIRIDGSTKNVGRTSRINKFQSKENCRVAVLSLKACNTGITLTAAQLIVFAELDWNPSTLSQAESRAHRIGQEGQLTCRYLLADGTADDIIWNILHTKQTTLKGAGLFEDDLRNNDHIAGPNSSGNITKYLVRTNKNNSTAAKDTIPTKIDDENIKDLLDDGEDDDFADLDF